MTVRLEPAFDPRAFRHALGQFPTGVCVVTCASGRASRHDDEFVQLAVARSAAGAVQHRRRAASLAAVATGRRLRRQCAGGKPKGRLRPLRQVPLQQMGGDDLARSVDAPVLPGVAAVFECAAWAKHDGGDHVLFIAEVTRFRTASDGARWFSAKGDTRSCTKPSSPPRSGRSTSITDGGRPCSRPDTTSESLKDGRQVFINGQLVATSPSTGVSRTAQSIGRLCSTFSCGPETRELMTFGPPMRAASRANRIWQLPRAIRIWSSAGRRSKRGPNCTAASSAAAPDHVASCISGMYMGLEVFEPTTRARRRARRLLPLCARQRTLPHLRDHQSAGRPLERRRASSRTSFSPPASSTGTARASTMRGAKMLATGGVMANEMFVTCIQPLRAGDEAYAVSFACR